MWQKSKKVPSEKRLWLVSKVSAKLSLELSENKRGIGPRRFLSLNILQSSWTEASRTDGVRRWFNLGLLFKWPSEPGKNCISNCKPESVWFEQIEYLMETSIGADILDFEELGLVPQFSRRNSLADKGKELDRLHMKFW